MIAGIPVYVISLKDSETRRRNMTERLGALGIPFQFVDAIDGRTQRLPDVFDGARIVRDKFGSESAVACAASHRVAHRIIADGGAEFGLVFQDDAQPANDFCELLSGAPTLDFDVLKFDGVSQPHAVVGQIGRYSIVVGGGVSVCAAGYLIRRSAAQRFCSLPVIDDHIDVSFNDRRLSLRVFELDPWPVVQDGQTRSLNSFQPRHREKRRLGFLERMALSFQKRERLLRLYGLRVAATIEFQKRVGNRR